MDTISVMMSTYNGEKYLNAQIESLLAQRNVIAKIYIRDDGSIDGTIRFLRELEKEKNIHVFYGKNMGYGRSFMELLKLIPKDTDYYAFSDQDDVWLDNKLENAIQKIYSINGPAAYCASPNYVNEKLEPLIECHSKIDDLPTGEVNVKWGLAMGLFGLGCTMVFNSSFCKILSQADSAGFKYSHDNLISVLCPLVGFFYKDDKKVLLYRQHRNNVGSNKTRDKNVSNMLKNKLNNFNNQNGYLLRIYIYEQFCDVIDEENLKLLKNTISYKKSLPCTIKLILKQYPYGLGLREKIKFVVTVLFRKY